MPWFIDIGKFWTRSLSYELEQSNNQLVDGNPVLWGAIGLVYAVYMVLGGDRRG